MRQGPLPDFDALQKAVHSDPYAMILGAFDVMHLDGHDLYAISAARRAEILFGPCARSHFCRCAVRRRCVASYTHPVTSMKQMKTDQIPLFVQDIVALGCEICAVGDFGYVIGDADLSLHRLEAIQPH